MTAAVVVAVTVGLLVPAWHRSRCHRRLALRLVAVGPRPSASAVAPAGPVSIPPAWVSQAVARAALPWPPSKVWRSWAVLAPTVTVGAAVVGGPVLAVLGAVAVVALPAALVATRSSVADDRLDDALGPALESMARSVRSGASLRQAVSESVASGADPVLAAELGAVVADADRGAGLAAAVDRWAHTRPTAAVRLAGAALCLAAETGGAPGRPLDGVAASLRERSALQRELHALGTQARLSAVVISLAPIGFTVLAAGVDPETGHFLVRSSVGQLCLTAGVALDVLGALWMRRLARVPV
ncbi:MAG: type II secretion system F family protein [Acidimicrobiia bacterium]